MIVQALIEEKIFTEAFLFWLSDLPWHKFWGGVFPLKMFENFIPKITGNAPKFYKTIIYIVFQLYKVIFPPRNSVLIVDQL